MNTTSAPNPLRPDVAVLVDRIVAEVKENRRNPWPAYERGKRAISAACGWDAPADQFDQDAYDRAAAILIRRAGL